jgi:hypothetical protein
LARSLVRAFAVATVLPKKSLEPTWRQLCVPDGVLDGLVAELGLQGAGVDAVVCQLVAAGVASMCGCALIWSPADAAVRSIMRAKPAGVNGGPRSLTKTKGEVASRWSLRNARSSLPVSGCVAGEPFFRLFEQ